MVWSSDGSILASESSLHRVNYELVLCSARCQTTMGYRSSNCWTVPIISNGKFGFSRPDLDGNKAAKGKCLARKVRVKEVTEGRKFFNFLILSQVGKG